MSRPLRIEFPGAWYHVMNRGRRREAIFLQPGDYDTFLHVLRETAFCWNLNIAAYCLMPNHYHLLVQTPEGNISRCMRHINGVYTQRFNRAHQQDGQLFRGRYKAVLVEDDSHLLEVMRYIHRNPLNADLTERLDEYPWSSHCAYLSSAKRWEWLHRDVLLNMLATEKAQQKKAYSDFVSLQEPQEIVAFYAMKKLSSLLGGKSFKEWVRDRFNHLEQDQEITEAQALATTPQEIIEQVCRYYILEESILKKTRRGTENTPRDVAIYLARRCSRKTLSEIGHVFGIDNYSTVSSVVQRIKSRKDRNSDLGRDIEVLITRINKSQKQT